MRPTKQALNNNGIREKKNPEEMLAFLQSWLVLDFQEQIATLMESKGITHSDLAKRLGVSRPYVSSFFRGENVTLHTAVKFALALECCVDVKLVPLSRLR